MLMPFPAQLFVSLKSLGFAPPMATLLTLSTLPVAPVFVTVKGTAALAVPTF
jgi:hypothetical protein